MKLFNLLRYEYVRTKGMMNSRYFLLSFLQNWQIYGSNIPFNSFIQLCENIHHDMIWRYNIIPILYPIVHEYKSTIQSEIIGLNNHRFLVGLIRLFNFLKYHRKQLMSILQQEIKRMINKFYNLQLRIVYKYLVQLHIRDHKELKNFVKNKYLQKILQTQQYQNVNISSYFMQVNRFIYLMLIDQDNNIQQIKLIISILEKKIIPNLKIISLPYQFKYVILSKIANLFKIKNIKIQQRQYQIILKKSLEIMNTRFNQDNKIYTRYDGYTLEFNQNTIRQTQSALLDNAQFKFGGSVFENIFQRQLRLNGYLFESNIIIGGCEYDLKIIGKNKKPYIPLQGINTSRLYEKDGLELNNCIDPYSQYVRGLIQDKKIFQHPIIINLNGHTHYINSDEYGDQRILRSEEITYEFLSIYGYKKYNIVDGRQWQKITDKPCLLPQFLKNIIENPKDINIKMI